MKTKLTLIAILGLLLTTAVKANNNNKSDFDSTKCLELEIKVMANTELLDGATITIYLHNKAIGVFNNDMLANNSAFVKTELKKNMYYVLEISKPGYITKSVIVSTKMPDEVDFDSNDIFKHQTTIVLVKQDEMEITGKGHNLGSPVGIIYYDVQEEGFMGSLIVTQPENDETILSMVERLGY